MSSMVRIVYLSFFSQKYGKFPKNSNPTIRCVFHLLLLKLLNSMRQCHQRKRSLCAVVAFGRKSPIDCESNCNKFSRSHRFTLISLHAILTIFKFAPCSTCLGLDCYGFNSILQHARLTTSVHSKNVRVFPTIAAYRPR